MRVSIEKSEPRGRVTAPPSKSEAHRLLLCAACAEGESVIESIAFGDDILSTAESLSALGCVLDARGNTLRVRGGLRLHRATLPCRESGSTLRFLLPVCLAFGGRFTFTGSGRLFQRPLDVYEELFPQRGISVERGRHHITVEGKLTGGEYFVRGDRSSQFISGLLLAAPLTGEDLTVHVLPPFESRPYTELTAQTLRRFGADVRHDGETTFFVPAGQRLSPRRATVGGDWSNAAVWLAFKENGAALTVDGLDEESVQGDRLCKEMLRKLKDGCPTLDLSDTPDLAPILFAFAAAHHGAVFTGTDRLRLKESDRIECMKEELHKFGAELIEGDNRVTLRAGGLHAPGEPLYSHNDHRIAMAAAFLLTLTGGELCGAEAVSKSDPDFFTRLKGAGVRLHFTPPEEQENRV